MQVSFYKLNGANYERIRVASQIDIGLNEVSGIVASQGDSVIALQTIADEIIAKTSATQYIVSAKYVITSQTYPITIIEFIPQSSSQQINVTFSSTQSYGNFTVALYTKNELTQSYEKLNNLNLFNTGITTITIPNYTVANNTFIFLESIDGEVPFNLASPLALSAEIFVE